MRQLVYEKENSEFKPVKLRLKNDLVSYPARAEGLVNMVNFRLKIDLVSHPALVEGLVNRNSRLSEYIVS